MQNPPPRARTETWAMCAGVIASGRAWGWGGLAATRMDGKAGLLTTIRMITGSLTFFSEWVTEQIPLCFFFFYINRKKTAFDLSLLVFTHFDVSLRSY